ncbi:hypothetical protein AOQ84DRAFT_222999 [Glonium stellatum]|uniref:Uncharacterized protein n=1 Tax=Glonium stellatum TaxID=574774 RepID=A0A8E2EZQ0_9PEZI|nr:hypothetical protein AOQ84DRAFT_222999 [Glonium stellatum]
MSLRSPRHCPSSPTQLKPQCAELAAVKLMHERAREKAVGTKRTRRDGRTSSLLVFVGRRNTPGWRAATDAVVDRGLSTRTQQMLRATLPSRSTRRLQKSQQHRDPSTAIPASPFSSWGDGEAHQAGDCVAASQRPSGTCSLSQPAQVLPVSSPRPGRWPNPAPRVFVPRAVGTLIGRPALRGCVLGVLGALWVLGVAWGVALGAGGLLWVPGKRWALLPGSLPGSLPGLPEHLVFRGRSPGRSRRPDYGISDISPLPARNTIINDSILPGAIGSSGIGKVPAGEAG